MAERRYTPKRTKSIAAEVAIFFSAAAISLPALATNNSEIPCPKSEQATLNVAKDELVASKVSHDISYVAQDKGPVALKARAMNPASLLAPRAEAAIREAFEDVVDEEVSPAPTGTFVDTTVTPPMAEVDAEAKPVIDDAKIETDSGMTTRLPGVSDDDLSRYKKQMFRRDI